MGVDILIGILVVLLGGSSAAALKEKHDLKTAHQQVAAQKADIDKLNAAEAAQQAAQAREDADRKARDADLARQAQIRGTYHTATDVALKAVPPDVSGALKFNALAIGADEPISATSMAQGQVLAQATIAQQAQLIADLQAQLKQARGDIATKDETIAADIAAKVAATQQIGTLTGTVAVANTKLDAITSEKTDLLSKFGLLSAKYGQWVFWTCLIGGIIFVLAHLGLFAHLSTRSQLAAAKSTVVAQQATIDAHTQTIKTLASQP